MKPLLLLLALIIVAASCRPNPRYRVGELPPRESADTTVVTEEDSYRQWREKNRMPSLRSADLIELGRVIQWYLGRPYKPATRHDRGLDCSRFTMEVFRKFNGTELPRSSEEQFRTGRSVNRDRLQFGDLVFFKIDGRQISHVGIFIDYGEFIHASESTGIMISRFDDEYWRRRYAGARRILY
ncbi:MAG: NlpC/P60 family protein [Candidatus Zixiibacteriota bacterium]